MKRWAFIVLGLYLLIMVVLAMPVAALAFAGQVGLADLPRLYASWPFWLWLVLMLLCQAALLSVPVRVASRRPVTRRSLLLPVLVAGLMMGSLAAGAVYSLAEAVFRDKIPEWPGWAGVAVGVLIWCGWSLVFYRMSRSLEPSDVISKQCRLLLKGSILELLIAVPTHIVARSRDYCCAGFMTFLGITLGLSVMVFSFGPAVFFLYVDRWRRLHPV